MGEAAKVIEPEFVEQDVVEQPFEDLLFLCNGETDNDWRYGSD